jgi:hypothetical protein
MYAKKGKLCIGGSAGGKLTMVSLVRGTRLVGGVDVILVHDFISVVYDMRTTDYTYYEVALNAGDAEPVMTAQGLQRLQHFLGLEVAERFRVQRALVFERCVPYAERVAQRAM